MEMPVVCHVFSQSWLLLEGSAFFEGRQPDPHVLQEKLGGKKEEYGGGEIMMNRNIG